MSFCENDPGENNPLNWYHTKTQCTQIYIKRTRLEDNKIFSVKFGKWAVKKIIFVSEEMIFFKQRDSLDNVALWFSPQKPDD